MFFDPAIVVTLCFKDKKAKQDEEKFARGLAFTVRMNKRQLQQWHKQFTR